MGSPVVAILALVLGYSSLYAGIKNVSLLSVFKGTPVSAATASDVAAGTGISNATNDALAGVAANQKATPPVVSNTQPVGTPRKAQ